MMNFTTTIVHAKTGDQSIIHDQEFPVRIVNRYNHPDRRGNFVELYTTDVDKQYFPLTSVQQISMSESKEGVFRGMHFQYRSPMNKMIQIVRGIADFVALDLHPNSPTFLHYGEFTLFTSSNNVRYLYVPWYCAIGFHALEHDTRVLYFHDATHNPDGAVTINYKSLSRLPELIPDPILSDKDRDAMSLDEFEQNVLPLINF